jgi:Ca-activated chloride channel family protein
VPDLFAGRAATVFLRVKKGKSVTVTGKFADGKEFKQTVKAGETDLGAVAHLWARTRVTDLEDRFRLGGDQDKIRREILSLALQHMILTRFTSFVVVDESEIVNAGGEGRKVVQPVHMPAQWEMKAEEAERCSEKLGGAGMAAIQSTSVAPMACKPAPSPAPQKVKAKKRFGFFGGKDDDEISLPKEPSPSSSDVKSFEKSFEALRKALEAAKARLEKGQVPSAGPVDQARKALIRELAGSPLGTALGSLQRLLRSAILELVAALGAPGASASALLPAVERALRSLDDAAREGNVAPKFWEKMI